MNSQASKRELSKVGFCDYRKKMILIWIVVWLVLIVVGLELFFRSGVLWRVSFLEPYFLNVGQRWHHNAFVIEQIKNRKKSLYDEYFVLLGGSATGVESITTDKEVARSLSELTGKRIGFNSIVASYGTIVDFEKIVHTLVGADVTFVIGVSPLIFINKINDSYQFHHKK